MTDNGYIDEEVPWPEFQFEADTAAPDATASGVRDSSGRGSKATATEPLTPAGVLKKYWGYDSFRGIQEAIITSILDGRDTLGLMPTGGGKSVTFQVPALMLDGLCIVVTPLIALMKDQVVHLRQRGIKATAVHSGLTHEQILRELDNSILGGYKFLYVSPERLHTSLFLQKLQKMKVSFVTIDEAHCISQWGYDFRPSYLQIREIRHTLPSVPFLALTATATPEVIDDIAHQLEFRDGAQTFRMSFDRPNLIYRVVETDDKLGSIFRALHRTAGSVIVYTRSRAGTRNLALALQEQGIPASYYHAGLSNAEKDTRQQMWQEGRARVMVATNAFGMGIDKADVRYVFHLDPPDSLEAYFQEAGRAGRDGQPAQAVLYYSTGDVRLMHQRIPQTFPPKERVRTIYDDLACFFQLAVGDGQDLRYEFDIDEFCRRFHHFPVTVESALRILQRAGYLLYDDEDGTRSRVMLITRRDDLYDCRFHHPVAERLLNALLRYYEGLFSDYVNIDESFLARECECTEEDIYDALLGLTRLRILHYVPGKRLPSIHYCQRRVNHDRVLLSKAVYEDRLEQYMARMLSVIRYLENDAQPRCVQLLEYFGEEVSEAVISRARQHEAGSDVADLASAAPATGSAAVPAADSSCAAIGTAGAAGQPVTVADAVAAILSDGAMHHPSELRALPYPPDDVTDAVLALIDRGCCTIVNGHFKLKH